MKRTFTCIVCPNGCEIDAEYEGSRVISVTGNLCPKGKTYVTQELVDPRRTIATSMRVDGGELPLQGRRPAAVVYMRMQHSFYPGFIKGLYAFVR